MEDRDNRNILASGRTTACANEDTFVKSIPVIPGRQDFFIMRWACNGVEYAKHYIGGYIPMDFALYKKRLNRIETLPKPFSAHECIC